MSKQTKIIAIVGGVLIVVVLALTQFKVSGGIKGAFGCASTQKGKERPPVSVEDLAINDCKALGHVVKRDAEGKAAANNPADPSKPCNKVVSARCAKDKAFAGSNQGLCKRFAAPAEDKE